MRRKRLQQIHDHSMEDCVILHTVNYLSSVSHYCCISLHRLSTKTNTLTASYAHTLHWQPKRKKTIETFYVNKSKPVALLEHYDFNKEIIRLVFLLLLLRLLFEMHFRVRTVHTQQFHPFAER